MVSASPINSASSNGMEKVNVSLGQQSAQRFAYRNGLSMLGPDTVSSSISITAAIPAVDGPLPFSSSVNGTDFFEDDPVDPLGVAAAGIAVDALVAAEAAEDPLGVAAEDAAGSFFLAFFGLPPPAGLASGLVIFIPLVQPIKSTMSGLLQPIK